MKASMLKGSFDFNLFRAIEVFAAVVETRHVTQAAQMLGMTQSAASQHLKNLETALGVSLIDRNLRPSNSPRQAWRCTAARSPF
jgi:DNA-binding transcriptional LysR family regulator